jgi:adenine/guanine/hypoxanthine permease
LRHLSHFAHSYSLSLLSTYTVSQQELGDFKNGLSLTGGDLGSLAQLFFDNLSTLLGALFALQGLTNMGDISVSQTTMDEYVWGKIVPGVGITLVVGNVYYSWQAIRLTNAYGRQYTAQPYGLNTPAAFAFVFNIIYTVFFIEGGGDAAFITGYKVALAANFITGLISIFLGIFGRLILKVVPPPALL